MTHKINVPLVFLSVTGVGLGLAAYFHRVRWNRETLLLIHSLKNAAPAQETGKQESKLVSFENFDLLPKPVAKYLRFALQEGQPLIRSVRIVQLGSLRNLGETPGRWIPFTAVQVFSVLRPGFVWDAHIAGFPWVRVRDAYSAGRGAAQVSALSLMTLANEQDKTEMDAGALIRYLAEAVWFPTALLPSPRLKWTPIDRDKALATLTDVTTTVSLEYQFGETGEITGVYTPGRYRAVGGRFELTPWGGQHRCYQHKGGMRIPTEGEVQWHLPGGVYSVWEGRIMVIEYDYAE